MNLFFEKNNKQELKVKEKRQIQTKKKENVQS